MKQVTAGIINIGDEILIGQIVNTNAVWIAKELNLLGVPVAEMLTIGDTKDAIITAVREAFEKHDIIILTGGLGPTKDDITKVCLAEFFNCGMRYDEEVFKLLDAFFTKRGRVFSEVNKSQCYVPEACTVLMNHWGTAPGMLFEKDGRYLVSLPGVPNEMQELMRNHFLPFVEKTFTLPPLIHRSFVTEGVPESELMKTIETWEDALPPSIRLAYLPSGGVVKLRMSSLNEDGLAPQRVDAEAEKLHAIIGPEIFGYDEDTLELVIKRILEARGQTITTAESCTGGYIAHKLTSVPGVSKVYPGSVVAYDYHSKTSLLGVQEDTLKIHGAVSRETVIEMAAGARERMKTDYAIAVSGIAGPDGGTTDKPVGTVWMAWATPTGVHAKKFLFGRDRNINIHRTYQASLNVLRKLILEIPVKEGFWG